MSLGIYIHVPFCAAICNYCNFNRGLLDDALKGRYVRALEAEIRREADGAAVDSIYFGGGTPSLLDPAEGGRIVAACRGAFGVTADAEITLEVNPETVTTAHLAAFREAGVNRLSIGVQSFRDEELRRLGRVHDATRAREAVRAARAAGFDNVSLDLMMWLPGQEVAEWLVSVDALVDVAPEHASLYILELYPNAPLRDEMARSGLALPADEAAAEMYLQGLARLDAAGFGQYKISNVARPGRASRHNLKYWQDGEWLAFGCGAHGTRGGTRWCNVPSTLAYVERIEAGAPVVTDRRVLSTDERVEEALFTGLRLSDGISFDAVRQRYGVDPWSRFGDALAPAFEAGLLLRDGPRVRMTRNGMLVANEILDAFV